MYRLRLTPSELYFFLVYGMTQVWPLKIKILNKRESVLFICYFICQRGLAWERVFSFGARLLGMQVLGSPSGRRVSQFHSPSPQSGLSFVWGKAEEVCSSVTVSRTSIPACRLRGEGAPPGGGWARLLEALCL